MKKTINITINAWMLSAVLLIGNLVTIGLWQPWSISSTNRTVSITGTSIIEAEPDQFVFSPYYQKSGDDKDAINNQLSKLSETIIKKLKDLGVGDSAIKTDINSYEYDVYYTYPSGKNTTTLYLTVTINDKGLAQKVQDYLITTSPLGSISPQISFSNSKQKELESSARTTALEDAKQKADATAQKLGANIGKVISVVDSTSNGSIIYPWIGAMEDSTVSQSPETSKDSGSYSIQPGVNEYSFSVSVVYELR